LTGQISEVSGAVKSTFGTGFATATSIEVVEGDLFVTNSTPGTITRTTLGGTTTTLLSGLIYPYGLSADGVGSIFFLEHGTGNIFQATTSGVSKTLLAVSTAFGVQFSAVDPSSIKRNVKQPQKPILLISDPLAITLWRLEAGTLTAFATNFTGKANLPVIGPTGLAFDSKDGSMYVADAAKLWRIMPSRHGKK
jgi:DNA-binding beta-propeller fold protein YncE